jgi:ribosomal protein S18 acetylase RimI-like enzyme
MAVQFSEYQGSIEYKQIDFDKVEDRGVFWRFYSELYVKEFPIDDERMNLNQIFKQAKRFSEISTAEHFCVIATRDEEIVGGILGDYFILSNSGFIEYIAVDSEERGKNIASNLIRTMTALMSEEAKKYNHETIDYCFLEVENPVALDDTELKQNASNRLGFWQKLSAKTLEMKYILPPLQEEKNTIYYLMLNVIIYSTKLQITSIPTETVLSFLRDYYQNVICIDDV